MRSVQVIVGALTSLAIAAPAGQHHCLGPKCAPASDALTALGFAKLQSFVAKQGHTNSTCTLETAAVRKEWSVLELVAGPEPRRLTIFPGRRCAMQRRRRISMLCSALPDCPRKRLRVSLLARGIGMMIWLLRISTRPSRSTARGECCSFFLLRPSFFTLRPSVFLSSFCLLQPPTTD